MCWRSHFLRADFTRAMLESLIFGIILWLPLFFLRGLLSFIWQIGLSLCIGLGCVFYCALRLKLPNGQRRQQVFFETTKGFMLCLLLGILELLSTVIFRSGTASYEPW
jgi:hypothetical protein